jgi:hypothetical protein
MELNEESKEILRTVILQNLHAARLGPGLKAERLLLGAQMYGFQTLGKEDLAKQIRYLAAHGMVEAADREMNRAIDLYRITEAGTAWLDENNLIVE